MADIVNPQAVRFANETVRPTADRYIQLYWAAKAFQAEWVAQNLAAVVPNTADVFLDGSAQDGRAPITGAMVRGMQANLAALVTDLEANSNLKLNGLTQVAVNDLPRV